MNDDVEDEILMVLIIQECFRKHTESYGYRSNTEGFNFYDSNSMSHMGNADIMFHFMEMLMELIKWALLKLQNILSLLVHTLSNMILCCLTLGLTGSAPFSHRWILQRASWPHSGLSPQTPLRKGSICCYQQRIEAEYRSWDKKRPTSFKLYFHIRFI